MGGGADCQGNVEETTGLVGVWCMDICFRQVQSEPLLPGRNVSYVIGYSGQEFKVCGRNTKLLSPAFGENHENKQCDYKFYQRTKYRRIIWITLKIDFK